MAVSQKIITNNQQPHNGYGYVGMAGNKGLSAAETLLGSGVFAVDADGNEVARENADLLGCRTIDSLVGTAKQAFS